MNNPLVSIVVITYNSAKYVLETLESAKQQTYCNIELIITDDCSTDNTVDLCDQWLETNKKNFVNVQLLIGTENVGIPANLNKGIKIAHGEWIKSIAGDDILHEDCICNFIKEYKGNSLVVIGNSFNFYLDNKCKKIYSKYTLPFAYIKPFFYLNSSQQYQRILERCFINAPAAIVKRELYDKIGYYDENYRMMEDWPFWVKCTRAGFKIDYLSITMSYYRVSHDSISKLTNTFYNERFYEDRLNFIKTECNPNISIFNILYWEDYYIQLFIHYVLYNLFKNRRTPLSIFVLKLIKCFSLKEIWLYERRRRHML
ncbi:glycosyltransferase family 2 protein [Bacteroides cellulosilyticus]|uniref:glycosyltransferase family 2 protein n=1 Tax=Bacteroides cellulosilyticus TaxID=246787 RepID=UPI0032F030C1